LHSAGVEPQGPACHITSPDEAVLLVVKLIVPASEKNVKKQVKKTSKRNIIKLEIE